MAIRQAYEVYKKEFDYCKKNARLNDETKERENFENFKLDMLNYGYITIQCYDFHIQVERFEKEVCEEVYVSIN